MLATGATLCTRAQAPLPKRCSSRPAPCRPRPLPQSGCFYFKSRIKILRRNLQQFHIRETAQQRERMFA
jgi:hypothetical protein